VACYSERVASSTVSAKHVLYIAGALCELLGIVAIAAPDLVPGLTRLGRWLEHWQRRCSNALRKRLGRPLHHMTHASAVEGHLGVTSSASATVSTGAPTIAAKVDFLLRRDQETQGRLNETEARLRTLEQQLQLEVERVRVDAAHDLAREIRLADIANRGSRLVGAAALAVGLGLSTWGNFLP
jgi:hypothetical protein